MITLQHALCNLIKNNGDIEAFEKELPYLLLPDSIRAYTGARPYTHFETNPTNDDVSWYVFPSDLKSLTKEKAQSQEKHLAEIKDKSVLGEETRIDKFIETNNNLPPTEYEGILTHLIQDYLFDDFIRETIDCTNKYEPDASFVFQGKNYNGQEIRKAIQSFEEYGFYILASYCYNLYGITTDQKWFDEHVSKVLQKEYPEDLAANTYKYMKIPEEMNEKIKNHDFSNIKYDLNDIKYGELYSKVAYYQKNKEAFLNEYYRKDNNNIKK